MSFLSPEYVVYIASPEWKAKRQQAIARAGGQCQFECGDPAGRLPPVRCTTTTTLMVHHITYERLGDELPEDIEVLCYFHHMLEHLLQIKCRVCTEPVLGDCGCAEDWLKIQLEDLRVDLTAKVNWKTLPTKDHLVVILTGTLGYLCPFCGLEEI